MLSIKRFKVVKNLILSKLDDILSKLSALFSLLEKLTELSQASLRTDNSLLKSTIHLINHQNTVSQRSLDTSQKQSNQLANLTQKISEVEQQLDLFSNNQAEFHRQMEGFLNNQEKQNAQLLQQTKQEFSERSETYRSLLDRMQKGETKLEVLEDHIKLLHSLVENNQINRSSGPIIVESEGYSTTNPEVGLMLHLYPLIPGRKVIDIGANIGQVSKCLLDAGYEVYAFEPYSPAFEKMKVALSHRSNFYPYRLAVGASDTSLDLFVVEELTKERVGEDPSLYNTFRKHPLVDGLEFTQTVSVPVRSLESLHVSAEIPSDIGIVKIDTEGFDTEVIRGMGEFRYPVVVTEFWDKDYVFGCEPGHSVADIIQLMQERNYHWYIVIHRQGLDEAAFFCNHPISVKNSWGNLFFFQHYNTFMSAMKWCSATLPITYFKKGKEVRPSC